MTARKVLPFLLVSLLSTAACKQRSGELVETKTSPVTMEVHPHEGEISIADPIIYEVIVKAHEDLTDWEKEMVADYKGSEMIRDLIDKVFAGKIPAYEYFSEKQMEKKQLQALKNDPEFGPEHIGRLQFTESWFYNPDKNQLRKQIHKVVFGYEDRDENDHVIGYKAAFFIYMDDSTP